MNNDDERDYAEEAAGRAELEHDDGPDLSAVLAARITDSHPGSYLAAARRAVLGEGPQPEPARITMTEETAAALGVYDSTPAYELPHFTPAMDGRGTVQVDASGFKTGWWTDLHEGEDYSLYWTATGLVLHCQLCPPAEISLGGHRAELGAVLRAVAEHRRTARH